MRGVGAVYMRLLDNAARSIVPYKVVPLPATFATGLAYQVVTPIVLRQQYMLSNMRPVIEISLRQTSYALPHTHTQTHLLANMAAWSRIV